MTKKNILIMKTFLKKAQEYYLTNFCSFIVFWGGL
jgi:hypothetical protein